MSAADLESGAKPEMVKAPPPPKPAAPKTHNICAPPPEAYGRQVALGEAKGKAGVINIFLMAIMAGAFIGSGSLLVEIVGGNMPGVAKTDPGLVAMVAGSFGLPFGLLMVVLTGSELVTGNFSFMTMALMEGRATPLQALKNWGVAYLGNLAGALIYVGIVYGSGLLRNSAAATRISSAKVSRTWGEMVARGVLCNWLVCMALWQANAAGSVIGKAIGVFFPIMAFVAQGAEHCVANMFMIPMGMAEGSGVTVGQFLWNNLIPVTIGNFIGGAFGVAFIFGIRYGRVGKMLKIA